MDAVTTKPVTLARLRDAIAEGTAVAGRQRHPPRPGSATLAAAANSPNMLGEEAVAEIVAAFAEDTQATSGSDARSGGTGDTQHDLPLGAQRRRRRAQRRRRRPGRPGVGAGADARIAEPGDHHGGDQGRCRPELDIALQPG